MHHFRFLQTLAVVLLPSALMACTFFKVTQNGYTMVGNNEDAWSINSRIRFENGKSGEYGAVYLGHFNGSPMREMLDQGGMNEAGLMFDGLGVPYAYMPRQDGLPLGDFAVVLQQVMRTCSTVHEAAAQFRKYDMGLIAHAMLVLADRNGDYLVVEGDTLYTGNDATYALANFRPSTCTNFDAVPIPRYQKGRALIAQGADTSLAFCTAVMDSMRACRTTLGNGTLYTNILDLQRGLIHLYFYHDYSELRTFDLKKELSKGDHNIEMASLFGKRPEYDALLAYITPFHQPWLFWMLAAFEAIALLTCVIVPLMLLLRMIGRARGRHSEGSRSALVSMLPSAVITSFLIPFLLLNEGVFYFGLGEGVDKILHVLVYLPLLLFAFTVPLVRSTYKRWRSRTEDPFARTAFATFTASQCALVVMLFYWDMVW